MATGRNTHPHSMCLSKAYAMVIRNRKPKGSVNVSDWIRKKSHLLDLILYPLRAIGEAYFKIDPFQRPIL